MYNKGDIFYQIRIVKFFQDLVVYLFVNGAHLLQDEVRSLAVQMDLPNQARKDSQGICFLGKVIALI